MAQNREKDETLELKVPTESPLSLSCPENSCKNLPSAAPATTSSSSSGCGSVGPGIGPDPARVDRGAQGARPRSGEGEARDQPGPAQVVEERKRTATEEAGPGGETAKRVVNRCSGCRKRVGLTGFRCRCGDLFCAEHRYSDRHECSYDYKTAGRAAIARENPVVRAAKILKV